MKSKIIVPLFLLFLLAALMGCGKKSSSDNSSGTYRDTFTEDEMKNGTAQFDMDEKLIVDAVLTPQEKYAEGLNSYYIKHFYECKKGQSKELEKNPTIYHKNYEELNEWFSTVFHGKLDKKLFRLDLSVKGEPSIIMEFSDDKKNIYTLDSFWGSYEKAFGDNDALVCPFLDIEKKESVSGLQSMFSALYNFVPDYKEYRVDFESEVEKAGEKYKEKLQELTGRKLYEQYDVIALTEESVKALKQSGYSNGSYSGQDFLQFRYYYDIDGLPFKRISLDYTLKTGEKASDTAMMNCPNNANLGNLSEDAQKVVLNKDGIYLISTSNYRYPGKIYKRNQNVISPNEILEKIKAYYEKTLILKEIVIKDISLVYAGYFSDFSDGIIEPIVTPVWDAAVYNTKERCWQHFIYDAFSGKSYMECGYE